MTNKDIRHRLMGTGMFDSVRCGRDGFIVARRSFFYRLGLNAEILAREVKRQIPGADVIEAREYFNSWPRESYWRVEFQVVGGSSCSN